MIWPFTSPQLDDLVAESLDNHHADQIAQIHSKTFKPAWTDGEFLSLLDKRNVGGVALREAKSKGGALVGFALVRVVADEAEILTVAVAPNWQNYGVGRKLMDMVIANLHVDRVTNLFLEVDEANKPAIALYKRLGFQQIAIRKNYYSGEAGAKSNALVMRRDVG